MKGKKSQMPLAVMFMGIAFNILNAMMQGYWIFFESYKQNYHVLGLSYTDVAWLWSPQFIIGVIIFFFGFYVNLRSDYIIRHLRKSDEDTKHYLPEGFMFEYVTSANYFGELMEWLGFAILTWSISGLVFFIWTFANLVPRANAIYQHYKEEFGEIMERKHLKRVFPFIY
jgi:3-oxo-5-alpha-steroid 4-dehydrogenase 1